MVVPSLNHNIVHDELVFHIQTEDSGPPTARISTHLFLHGNVVASAKSTYTDLVRTMRNKNELGKTVKRMMQEQHRRVAKALKANEYSKPIADLQKSAAPPSRGAPPEAPASAVRQTARPPEPGAKKGKFKADEPTRQLTLDDLQRQALDALAMPGPANVRDSAALLWDAAKGPGSSAGLASLCHRVVEGLPEALACAVVDLQTGAVPAISRGVSVLPQRFFDAMAPVTMQLFSVPALRQLEESLRQIHDGEGGSPEEMMLYCPPVLQFFKRIRQKRMVLVLVAKRSIDADTAWMAVRGAAERLLEALAQG